MNENPFYLQMSQFTAVKEQLKTTIGKISKDYEYEPLPLISQKLREGWFLYGDPIIESIYVIQFFVKSRDVIADPFQPYSEYAHIMIRTTSANKYSYEVEINEKLKEGWKLYGNPYYHTANVQVMVKPAAPDLATTAPAAAGSGIVSGLPRIVETSDLPRIQERTLATRGATRRVRKSKRTTHFQAY